MIFRAFLFDLDGTLVDTEQLWSVAISRYLNDKGEPAKPEEILSIIFGRSWLDIYRDIVSRFPRVASVKIGKMADDLREYYLCLRGDPKQIIIPSSVACLKRLSRLAPCAIVSGSTHEDVMQTVSLMECEKEVSFVLGAEDYPHGKPAPDGYAAAARKLGVPPETCIVFEDAPGGVLSAKRAGMRCVALDRAGARGEELGLADWIVSDLSTFTPEAFQQVCGE